MSPETLTPPAWRHRLTWPGIPTPWPSHPSTIIHRESRRHTRTASIFRETVRPHRLAAAVDSTAVSPLIRECTRGTRRSLIRDFPSDSPITGSKPPINLGEPKWVSAVQYRIGTSSNPIPYRSRALRGTMVPLRPRAQSLLWQDRDPMWAMPATRQRTLTRILQPNSMCTHMMEVVCYRTNLPTPSPPILPTRSTRTPAHLNRHRLQLGGGLPCATDLEATPQNSSSIPLGGPPLETWSGTRMNWSGTRMRSCLTRLLSSSLVVMRGFEESCEKTPE